MLHDIGKLVLDKQGQWGRHEDLNDEAKISLLKESTGKLNFQEVFGDDVVNLIKCHHQEVDEEITLEIFVLRIADAVNKAMHQIEEKKEFNRLKRNLQFYPYYKAPLRWRKPEADGQFREICEDLQKEINLRTLLEVQNHMLTYPHTSYIPHISLAFHHRFTAALFLLLIEKLETLDLRTDLKVFEFCLVKLEPDALDLFYRLRDITAHKEINKNLRKRLFRKLFVKYAQEIQGFGPEYNPFLFFGGDSIVFLYKNSKEIVQAFQDIINEMEGLLSLQVEIHTFLVPLDWKPEGNIKYSVYAPAEKVEVKSETISLFSQKMFAYPALVRECCQACGRPVKEPMQDDKGNILCKDCFSLRRSDSSSRVNIDNVAKRPDGSIGRLAYVFLTLPENLLIHAKEVANKKLISNFTDENGLPTLIIQPSQTGLLEYLQALIELEKFQKDLEKILQEIAEKESFSANAVFNLSSLRLYLLWEEKCWNFLRRLNRRRFDLHLETGLKVVFCDYKMPFWSLMRSTIRHKPEDTLIDIGKEGYFVFKAEEVRQIRELADLAKKNRVFPTQLEQISKIALKTNKDELFLELDTRKDRLRGLEKNLKEALGKLSFGNSEWRDREKRSIFVKYVAKLTKT